MTYTLTITDVNGNVTVIPDDDKVRCDNCGKPSDEAKHCISGGALTDGEWACCTECYDEMLEEDKCCCFGDLGEGVYRQQKY